jgi:UDP-4-amino-4,6-dideoxy-N-acetyl-beta-L-altrosamine N-acetyltransferase
MTEADLQMVLAWRNHSSVSQYMFTQHKIGLDEHRAWFSRVSDDKSFQLFIVQEEREPIGFVQLASVNLGGISDWGFYIRPDAPKGCGVKLGWTALNYAFKVLGLHKVCGKVIEKNTASINFHIKMGFTKEGELRDHHQFGGKYQTLICFGLLAKEWPPEQLF